MPHFATIYRLADALGIEREELIEFQPLHDRTGKLQVGVSGPAAPYHSHHTRQTQRDRPSELLVSYPEGLNNETGAP